MRRSGSFREPLSSRVLFPLVEREFTYDRYAEFLDRLLDERFDVVPLGEYGTARPRERVVVGLRHDVDDRLESALRLAGLERERGLRATYFLLHTAPYWDEPTFAARVARLVDLGHEIGFHNDLVTVHRLRGADPRGVLTGALARLRSAGAEVRGTAAHGSPWCHPLGYHNNYVFRGWNEPVAGFPSRDVPERLDPGEFGLEYEAYHLERDLYVSDSAFDERGRRRHPLGADLTALRPGERAIVLVHPCHWDASAAAKWARLGGKLGRRLRQRFQTRASASA